MRPPHGCRCCGLTARHDDDCLVPEMARMITERDRLSARAARLDAVIRHHIALGILCPADEKRAWEALKS